MQKVKEKARALAVADLLPEGLRREILRRAEARVGGVESIREIRVRAEGQSSVLFSHERVRLISRIGKEELFHTVEAICGGAVYAYRDTIAEGYLTMARGIRVGLSGRARYEGERLVGVSEIRSLVFRIPTGECEFGEELYSHYLSGIGRGMLIYSPPGVGKTTALRYLAKRISGGKSLTRVALIDERGELSAEDFSGCEAEVLSGYKKSLGIEIATRTLSPDLIMVDELSAADAEAVMSVIRSGVPLVATSHGECPSDLMKRAALGELIEKGAFEVLVGISHTGEGYSLKVDRV